MNKIITFCCKLLLLQFFLFNYSFAQVSYTINTIAGNGTTGFSGDGGPATSASFNLALGVAVDAAGNIYVADTENHRIRKIDAVSGVITTIAGNGTNGSSGDGGDALLAAMDPLDLKIDAAGNIYLVDHTFHRIRKIDAITNIITTVAGNGTDGFSGDGGQATSAQLSLPSAIALDNANNLYIADLSNLRIRKVDATTGVITTIAGNGTIGSSGDGGDATQAQLQGIIDIDADASGNVYLLGWDNRVKRVDAATGILTLVAGDGGSGYAGDGGNALQAQFNLPWGIMVGNFGDVYVADLGNYRLRKINTCDNTITTIAGNGTVGFSGDGNDATQAQISPWSLAQDNEGNIYFSETNRIRKLSPSSTSGYVRAGHVQAVAGSTIKVPVRSQDLVAIAGIQLEIRYDQTKANFKGLTDINPKLTNFSNLNYNGTTTPGELNIIWVDNTLQLASWQANEILFNIELEIPATVAAGDKLSINFEPVLAIDNLVNSIYPGNIPGCVNVVATSQITGTMKTSSDQIVTGVTLSLAQKDGTTSTINTNPDGSYNLDNLTPGTYTVTPAKQGAVQNGVDVSDVIALRRHILGKEVLNSPYKIVAGDLDMSGQINLIDLFTIRSITLGKTSTLTKSWRFVPTDYTFNAPTNPLAESFPESITTQLIGNQINQDFVAIKIGDVNGDADPSLRIAAQPLVLATPAQQVFVKQQIQVPITSTTDYSQIAGLQGTLEFNASVLKYKGITAAGLTLDAAQHLNLDKVEQGQLVFVYDDSKGEGESLQNGTVLFYITFEVIGALDQTSTLRFTNQLTPSKAYQADLTPQSLELNAGEIKVVAPQVNIFPNPAKRFQVNFGITQDKSKVYFSLRNQQGQVVGRQQKTYDQGQQQFTWQPNVASGIYFLTIEAPQFKSTKKIMIK